MDERVPELRFHGRLRVVPCTLCQRPHEQQYVGAVFRDDFSSGEDVCPRCLAEWNGGVLEQLREAERDAVRRRFPLLREPDVRRLVDDRYAELLQDAA